jgi:hypothetical protein
VTDETPALPAEVAVVNVGLQRFAHTVSGQGRPVVQVDWRIPGGGDPAVVAALRRLDGPLADHVDSANGEVLRRLDTGDPQLVGVGQARDLVPGMGDRTLLLPGPAIELGRVCDPLRRSVRATVVAEGWAADLAEAEQLIASGVVDLRPANQCVVVVPMASVVGPTTPVWAVELPEGRTRSWAPVGQGSGDVAWFGRETAAARERLVFLREAVAPVLSEALDRAGPVDVLSVAAQAVAMGDDVHVRSQAATTLLLRHLLPALVAGEHPRRVEVARFLSGNHLLFLTVGMAAARSLTAWAEQVEGASVVTTLARNGTDLGVRLPGEDRWFLAPAPMIGHALYHPGRGPQDSAPDIGDSSVLELVGLGGAAAAGSPAVAALVGGMSEAAALTAELETVCVGRSSRFVLPTQGGRGTPVAVDVRKVVEHGVTPKVTTGILHARDGSGQVGAGVAEAPLECFREALLDLDRRWASVNPEGQPGSL